MCYVINVALHINTTQKPRMSVCRIQIFQNRNFDNNEINTIEIYTLCLLWQCIRCFMGIA